MSNIKHGNNHTEDGSPSFSWGSGFDRVFPYLQAALFVRIHVK